MNESTVNQRLKILIKELGYSVRGFSNAVGVGDGTIRNYIDRGSKPGVDFIEKVLLSFERINPTWLVLGKGEMFLQEATSGSTNTAHIKKNNGIGINNGNATQHISLEDCKRNLEAAQREVEQLKTQLASTEAQLTGKEALLAAKDELIAAKEEMLSLLRAGHNRPN